VLPGNVGTFVLFLLQRIVFAIALIFSQMLLGCLTCCIGFLPYVSTVVALPLVVFMRAHAVYFLQQVGPRYVIIVEMPPPPPLHAFPVIPMPPRDAPPPQV
jgi:hypothetical protein